MVQLTSAMECWKDYSPTKTALFWSSVGAAVLTMFIGFNWGGWVTGGTAERLAAQSAEAGKAQFAAAICKERFLKAPNVRTRLTSLRKEDAWLRYSQIEDGGWVTFAGMSGPMAGAGEICAKELMAVKASDLGAQSSPATQSSPKAIKAKAN